jgi:hypothetical protein
MIVYTQLRRHIESHALLYIFLLCVYNPLFVYYNVYEPLPLYIYIPFIYTAGARVPAPLRRGVSSNGPGKFTNKSSFYLSFYCPLYQFWTFSLVYIYVWSFY